MNIQREKSALSLLACLGLLFALPGISLAQSEYEDVFIFGDSLSDSGNRYLMTGQTTKSPYVLIPTYPYAMGGHHYSNGETWVEHLAKNLKDATGGQPSLANPGKNGNYAYGGARGRNNMEHESPDSQEQAGKMIADYNGAPSDALYVIQFGGNDVRDALAAAQGDQTLATSFGILFQATYEVQGAIQTLYNAGARNFLVANSPNLVNAPAVSLQGGVTAFLTGIFVGSYNGELENRLIELGGNPGIDIQLFNMFDFTDELVNNGETYGLTNVTAPCLNFVVANGGKCESPEGYLFWDGFHPTKVAHKAIAEAAVSDLNGN